MPPLRWGEPGGGVHSTPGPGRSWTWRPPAAALRGSGGSTTLEGATWRGRSPNLPQAQGLQPLAWGRCASWCSAKEVPGEALWVWAVAGLAWGCQARTSSEDPGCGARASLMAPRREQGSQGTEAVPASPQPGGDTERQRGLQGQRESRPCVPH